MKITYKLVNGVLILLGLLLCTFCSNATIGTPESLRRAAETEPYHIFFLRTIMVMLVLSQAS